MVFGTHIKHSQTDALTKDTRHTYHIILSNYLSFWISTKHRTVIIDNSVLWHSRLIYNLFEKPGVTVAFQRQSIRIHSNKIIQTVWTCVAPVWFEVRQANQHVSVGIESPQIGIQIIKSGWIQEYQMVSNWFHLVEINSIRFDVRRLTDRGEEWRQLLLHKRQMNHQY